MSEHDPWERETRRLLRKRDAERVRLEHESTLSLDWETQHGGGAEAERVEDTLRALHAASDELELGIEADTDLDRTAIDPALATLRGADSPHIAPKRGGERGSDEGLRFSGASLSYGQIVVVQRRDLPAGAIEVEGGPIEPAERPPVAAERLLQAVGGGLALVGILLLVLAVL